MLEINREEYVVGMMAAETTQMLIMRRNVIVVPVLVIASNDVELLTLQIELQDLKPAQVHHLLRVEKVNKAVIFLQYKLPT